MISTKGRYSIRVLLDLAEHRSGDFIPMKEVAARQDISLKYIERLMPALKAAGLVESVHGIGGGYRLTREPEDYTLWEILELAEGDLAPVTCLQPDAPVCQRAGECRTLGVWQGFYKLTRDYFTHITLADLMNIDREYLLPGDVAGVLGTSDQWVRVCARQQPQLLGFPTVIMGSRVKIPRIPFLRYMGAII